MGINKETHVNASVILPIETYRLVQQVAKKNGRSASSEMAKAIEKIMGENKHGLENK